MIAALNTLLFVPVAFAGLAIVACGVFPLIDWVGVTLGWWPEAEPEIIERRVRSVSPVEPGRLR